MKSENKTVIATVTLSLMLILLTGIMVNLTKSAMAEKDTISLSKNLQGVYFDEEGNAWIRFDLHDNNQASFLQVLERECKRLDIKACMNSVDIFNLR